MSTQMTPADFRERLDVALLDGVDPTTGVLVEADITLGRRMLRRRRGAVVLGAASLVAVTALVAGIAGSADEPSQGQSVATAPQSDADLLAACRDGHQSDRATRAVFDAGVPNIKVETRNLHQIVLALEAADGRHWAWCGILHQGAEFHAVMEVYDATATTPASMYSSGAICTTASECNRFTTMVVDRRPLEVAAVEFWTADGERTTVESVDGYIVLNHVGQIPDGAPLTPEGLPVDFAPIKRVTFLDGNGTPIAAAALDGSGGGPDGQEVEGLPSIREFPALRGDQSIN